MVFYRVKTIKGHDYWYLQHSERVGNTVNSIHVMYVGKVKPNISALQYFRKHEKKLQGQMKRKQPPKQPTPATYASPQARETVLKQSIHEAYLEVRKDEPRYSGLIPIPQLKQKLKHSHPEFTEQEINEMLINLMNKRIIDLQVAYDPARLDPSEREQGIKWRDPNNHPSLWYYVRYRA